MPPVAGGLRLDIAMATGYGWHIRSPRQIEDMTDDREIIGRVAFSDSRPVVGVLARAYAVTLSDEQLLSEDSTDDDGRYQITLGEGPPVNLRVRLFAPDNREITFSSVLFRSSGRATVDLVVDDDAEGTSEFERYVTAVQPALNDIAIRWIASARHERLDRMLITGERHLRLVLDEYIDHYNQHRPRRALQQSPPAGRRPPAPGADVQVLRRDRLGGLIHEYAQVAYYDRVFGTHTVVARPGRSHELAHVRGSRWHGECSTVKLLSSSALTGHPQAYAER
jgi:hypothetical protein